MHTQQQFANMLYLISLDLYQDSVFHSWGILEETAGLDPMLQGVGYHSWVQTERLQVFNNCDLSKHEYSRCIYMR